MGTGSRVGIYRDIQPRQARGSGFRLGFGGLGLRVWDLGLRFREGR